MYQQSKAVFLLDLCILSYHLHSQTLIWPIDPYYEQVNLSDSPLRVQMMNRVHVDAKDYQRRGIYHGPADYFGTPAGGWQVNPNLDPIIANYQRLYPWRPSFTRALPAYWVLYNTPSLITNRIRTVNMAIYDQAAGPGSANPTTSLLGAPFPLSNPANPAATDLLYCFEGGTGAIEGKTTAAWSMMGFVLAECTANPGDPYDVYIVFRGSRSGDVGALRIATEAFWGEKGNPDWVTDMDFSQVDNDPVVSVYGAVSRGFRTSLKSTLPTIIRCLEDLHLKKGAPRAIYVTGHSLGGALAAHFTSAMVLGNRYGPNGTGAQMPQVLQTWPWRTIQLTTFSAPVVGDATFSWVFDQNVPSARIWLDGDPVTQERVCYPVGLPLRIPVYADDNRPTTILYPNIASHEPYLLRRNLIRDRLARGLPVDGLPALSGGPEKNEPWQYFKSLKGMLDLLLGDVPAGLGYPDLPGFFNGFRDNFADYVTELTYFVRNDAAIGKGLAAFLARMESPATMAPLKQALANGALGPGMWGFMCIGYLMNRGSASLADFRNAIGPGGFLAADYPTLA
jgi:hypothetical protein